MKTSKKSLVASGLSLAVSTALLLGTTFAWFTESTVSTGNRIQAGNLSVDAYAYDLADTVGEETFTIEGVNGDEAFSFETMAQDLKEGTNPIISDENFEPGKSNAKLLTVRNENTPAAKVSLQFSAADKGLMDALWFDFVQVENGQITSQFQKRPMSQLAAIGQGWDSALLPADRQNSVSFILVYGMYEEAGNQYQDAGFTADVAILAAQYAYETDGFDNTRYDADTAYPVADAGALVSGLEVGGIVTVADDMTAADTITLTGNDQSVLDLNEQTVPLDADGIIDLYDNAQITIKGGTKDQEITSEIGYLVRATDNARVIIEDGTYISGLTCVQAGGNAVVEIRGGHFSALTNWNDTYWLLNLIDGSNAQIIVTGGTFVNFDPSNNQVENPPVNFVADGYTVVAEEQSDGDIWYTVVPE